jgi:hypothetical protein
MQQPRASEWTRCRAIFFTYSHVVGTTPCHRRAARSHKKSTKQTIFSTMAQEDGSYPRLNASMLHSRQFVGKIVSLVGCVESFDGTNIQLKCADNAMISVHSGDAGFNLPPGTFVEVVGFVNEDNTVTLFVTRELTNDFDLDIYNKMLSVQHNPKFVQFFQ